MSGKSKKGMLKISASHIKIRGAYGWACGKRLMSVYVRFSDGSVTKTRELLPEVFGDFDKHGDIVGMEFLRPGEFDIDAMKQVAERYGLPSPETIKSMAEDVTPVAVA